jgi:hypothetical protein
MLTIVMAIAREVSHSADESVIEIGVIYTVYMLIILNVKRMSAYAYNMLGLCLVYSKDTIKIRRIVRINVIY